MGAGLYPAGGDTQFFGPCSPSLPFGSGIPFGGGVPVGSSAPVANSTQNIAFWQMGQSGLVSSQLINSVPSNWSIVGQRDFNGDGYTDLLWRDSATGTVAIWFMNGFQVASTTSLGAVPTNWNIYGTGNLDAASTPGACPVVFSGATITPVPWRSGS